MSVRMTEPKPGDARPVEMPLAEARGHAGAEKRKRGRFVLMAAVPVVLAAVGAWFWLTGGRYEDTTTPMCSRRRWRSAPSRRAHRQRRGARQRG